jgi:hypothetical protein
MPEKKLEELRAKREPLFQRFTNNPSQFHLAIEIKFIDDQIAESGTEKEMLEPNSKTAIDGNTRARIRRQREGCSTC